MSTEDLIRKVHELEKKADIEAELNARLKEAAQVCSRLEQELHALMGGFKAVLEQRSFSNSARSIFDYCKDLIGATSGYVALLSEDGAENEVLFLESGGLPCDVNPELPMPIRGLRADAYKTNQAVYHNDFMNSQWVDYMPGGHVILRNVMFSPLVVDGRTVGIMGLANKASDFTDNDAKMAAGFGELAAIALRNSVDLEKRLEAETQREKVIEDLEKALSEVKVLKGLLPMCSWCGKIRDDKGYWNKIETYIEKHSDARVSHGLCRECAKKHFPDMDIYDD